LRPVISGVTSTRVAITADVTDRERVDSAIGKTVAPRSLRPGRGTPACRTQADLLRGGARV
jgi:hypothetical protein